jgi:hypothetical protein
LELNKTKSTKQKQVPPSEKPMLMRRGVDKGEKNKRKIGREVGRLGVGKME